jgi:hypothetical protein
MLDSFRACPRKYQHRHVEGLTTFRTPAALSFGGAFHAAYAAFLSGEEKDKAITIGLKSMRQQEAPPEGKEEWRNQENLIKILDVVFAEKPMEVMKSPDGKAVVETNFLYPLLNQGETDSALSLLLGDLGYDEVLYSGILDAVGIFCGETCVVDHKTTTLVKGAKGEPAYFNSMFASSFKPHSATQGYAWGLSKFLNKPVFMVLINAIGVHTLRILSPNFTVKDWLCLAKFTISYSPEEIEEWRLGTIQLVKEMLRCKLESKWRQNTGACFNYMKPCPYLELCSKPEGARGMLKNSLYQHDEWNPLDARKKEAARLGE